MGAQQKREGGEGGAQQMRKGGGGGALSTSGRRGGRGTIRAACRRGTTRSGAGGRGSIRRGAVPSRSRKGGRTSSARKAGRRGGSTVPPDIGGMGQGSDWGSLVGEPTALPRTGRRRHYGDGRGLVERRELCEWGRVGWAVSAVAGSTGRL